MPAAPLPANEAARLAALRDLQILDTAPDEAFNQVVRLISRLFDVPIALVSLVDEDRQWFKARVGLDATETPRSAAFCAHAILGDAPLLVEDASKAPRFADNPLVTGAPDIRFYLGVPLITQEGARIGTLCAIDRKPHAPPPELVQLLKEQARIVVAQLELRRASRRLAEQNVALAQANELLEGFTRMMANDVMAPVRHIGFFLEALAPLVPEAGQGNLTMARNATSQLHDLLQALEAYRRAGGVKPTSPVDLDKTINAALVSLKVRLDEAGAALTRGPLPIVVGHPDDLQSVLTCLLDNAIKFRSERPLTIDVEAKRSGERWRIEVRDSGLGIEARYHERIFEPFQRLHRRSQIPGAGLGLALCKQVVEACGGTIGVASEPGVGSTFWFELPVASVPDATPEGPDQ